MAAYGALVSLMNDLDLIPNHPTHSFSFDNKQISSLSQTVNFLIDFMDNYDSQVLESRIASAAHAAHDVIESHVVDQIHAGTTLDGKSRSYFLLDLQEAIDSMDVVKREAIWFKAKSGSKETYSAAPASSEPPSSEKKNVMVGFDAAVVRLMEMLTGEPSARRVIPIVGMGGLGKTTLARNVFEHLIIQHHFDLRLWATISQEYSVENILNELLSQNSGNVSGLGQQLHQMLCGRRYLIVLDDMWSVKAWDEIQLSLPDNENGSCVIVTTRLSNLADHLSSSSPFVMDFLVDDQSWELFCGKTFGEEGCPSELEEIGRKIVKRCRGLPLSIVVIGGHLKRSSRAIEYWEKVANFINPISSLVEDDEQCLKIMSLSYEHLPACLKPCFLYLGIFEEDASIDASELFRFWIAEGFVKGKKDLSLEEVAEDYLKDLSERNLILVRERRWNGKVEYFGIHDTVRELCLKVGEQEKFFGVLDTAIVIRGGRERRIVVPREVSSLQPHAVGVQLPSLHQEKCVVLENLHTLLNVRNLRLTEEVFKRMPNIKNLDLSYSDRPGDCEASSSSSSYYCPHNLGRLNKLESLDCCFDDGYKWRDVVRSIVLPTSLEELTLRNCHWEDLGKMMTRLGSLNLYYIRGPEWDLAMEELEFPRLKTLTILGCDDLINWNANSSHFPVLEILDIWGAYKLSEIPFDIGEIPTLRRIRLRQCSVSAAVSAMRIVVEQESLGNENLLLQVNWYARDKFNASKCV